jgi:hypothetical protein
VPGLPAEPYHILVSRADDRPHTQVWSFGFERPIPDAPLPLVGRDEHVPIPLQSAFEAVYRARNFRDRLDYSHDPEGPLTSEQRALIRHRLSEAVEKSEYDYTAYGTRLWSIAKLSSLRPQLA